MRVPTELPAGTKKVLERELKEAKTKEAYQRVLCVWLRASMNMLAPQVAQAIGWHEGSVRRVQSQYLNEKETFFERPGRGGRRNENLEEEEEEEFLKGFFDKASAGGILEVSEIKAAYEKRVGHPVPKSTVYRMLDRHGWRKVAPRPYHPKRDPLVQESFKKTSRV